MPWPSIIDRHEVGYVTASALQLFAMLALALGNGYVALLGAIASAVLSSASGPVENILIARYTPSRYHGLGFGAKFVVALGASPLAILLIAWVRKTTGSLDLLFLGQPLAVVPWWLAAAGPRAPGLRRGSSRRRRIAAMAPPPCRSPRDSGRPALALGNGEVVLDRLA
jgi:hypothetical protein